MLVRLLEALEKNVKQHGCAMNDVMYDYDETTCHECQGDCVECKKASLEQIKKLKQSLEENTVKSMELDGLDSLKYKLTEKYNVLFNKFEVTEFERGELNAITQILYLLDDVMGKQATSDKTNDTSSV